MQVRPGRVRDRRPGQRLLGVLHRLRVATGVLECLGQAQEQRGLRGRVEQTAQGGLAQLHRLLQAARLREQADRVGTEHGP